MKEFLQNFSFTLPYLSFHVKVTHPYYSKLSTAGLSLYYALCENSLFTIRMSKVVIPRMYTVVKCGLICSANYNNWRIFYEVSLTVRF